MFKEGNLVRLISEDDDGEVMRVLEYSNRQSNTTLVHSFVINDSRSFDTDDLELVNTITTKQLQEMFG